MGEFRSAVVRGIHSLPCSCLSPACSLDTSKTYKDLTVEVFKCDTCGAALEATSIEFTNCCFSMEYTCRSNGRKMPLPKSARLGRFTKVDKSPVSVPLWPSGVMNLGLQFQ